MTPLEKPHFQGDSTMKTWLGAGKRKRSDECKSSRFAPCPICSKSFPLHSIDQHVEAHFQRSGEKADTDTDTETNTGGPKAATSPPTDEVAGTDARTLTAAAAPVSLPSPKLASPKLAPLFLPQSSSSSLSPPLDPDAPAPLATPHPDLPGQLTVEDFISPEEEEMILRYLDTGYDPTVSETGSSSSSSSSSSRSSRSRSRSGGRSDHGGGGDETSGESTKASPTGADSSPATWKRSSFNGTHVNQGWGVRTDLAKRQFMPPSRPMPSIFKFLVERMRQVRVAKPNAATAAATTTAAAAAAAIAPSRPLAKFRPNEANAIDYRRRQGHWLRPHCDDRHLSGQVLINLCLAGDAVMTYSRDQPSAGKGGRATTTTNRATGGGGLRRPLPAEFRVPLPRRALQIQSGCVRYDYRHGIANRDLLDDRRVSITFRENRHPLYKMS